MFKNGTLLVAFPEESGIKFLMKRNFKCVFELELTVFLLFLADTVAAVEAREYEKLWSSERQSAKRLLSVHVMTAAVLKPNSKRNPRPD